MKRSLILSLILVVIINLHGKSPSFDTYVNPIIPGDHPDPTLTKIGDDFYTSGSSFNPTPQIYHSTDLVHWEVIAQPVSSSWNEYGDEPGGGIWGGHMVLYNDTYWHFFGRGGGNMYFVTADQPEGPWSSPTRIKVPSSMSGLGVDNSIFIDEENDTWYLLAKHGRENNHIVELGHDGQPTGKVLDLTWLNPDSEDNPYGWAEGPVMWKHNGYYYYSFAQHLVGEQYVMRSDSLTEKKSAWTIVEGGIFTGSRGNFDTPNHIAPAVMLEDSTAWTIGHSYHRNWYAQGRQGLLLEVTYNDKGFPVIQYPLDKAENAPDLPSSGIPWMVPKSDMFNGSELSPEWSLLGYTPENTYSLNKRKGWLHLEPYQGNNTVIKNDGEHQYTLITRLDFNPESSSDEAGIKIINGPETLEAKVFSSVDNSGNNVFKFSFDNTAYKVSNTIGSTVWLKLERDGHMMSGYYSSGGYNWTQIGNGIDASPIDEEQTDFNNFTGNQQGLYVKGKTADFDLYIYRDAYSSISAQYPANFSGISRNQSYLGSIHSNDWAMYAGVEFGKKSQPENSSDYQRVPDSLQITASSASSGGKIEIWLDSISTGQKIAECPIKNTGGWDKYSKFKTNVDSVSGRHDVYLRFKGNEGEELLRLKHFEFTSENAPATDIKKRANNELPSKYSLSQNFPNPFNPTTKIKFNIPKKEQVKLEIYDTKGRKVETVVKEVKSAGTHTVKFNGSNLASGVYFYRLSAGSYTSVKKLVLLK